MRVISAPSAADAAHTPALPKGRQRPYPGLTAALARDAANRLKAAARATYYRSAIARLALAGPLPAHLAVLPDALAPATLEGAQDILRGVFSLPGGRLTVRGQSPFDAEADAATRADLHRFRWLAHLERAGGRTAEGVARALVEDWLDRFERWRNLAWRSDVLGPRLVSWAAHFRFLTADNDLLFRSRLVKAMAEQTRHLARAVGDAPEGPPRLIAAAALVTLSAVLPDCVKRPSHAHAALAAAIAGAFTADGGIVTRNPADQADAVAALMQAARALGDARLPMPPGLETALNAAAARLGLLRFGDGGTACFQGSDEGDRTALSELDGSPRASAAFAPEMGYARLTGGESVLVFDCGGPPRAPFAAGGHAAPLAFEFAHGEHRLIVNGGIARRRGPEWVAAARRTAAHATLQVGEADAGEILGSAAARRLGAQLYGGSVSGDAAFGAEGGWAEGRHDFYVPRFGATHSRRLYLSADGEDLRGEDVLTRAAARGVLEAVARFPLHPDIRATLAQGGDSVMIAPPGGLIWRFRFSGEGTALSLEDAVYMGGAAVRRTQAITLRAAVSGPAWTLRWALKTETPGHRPRQRLV